jgi:Flp pilus assembly protein TadB
VCNCFLISNYKEADETEKKAREKQARVEASMKEREKEVKESLETSMRERDKERDQHKKDEAIQTFKALLVDLVSGLAWMFLHMYVDHSVLFMTIERRFMRHL